MLDCKHFLLPQERFYGRVGFEMGLNSHTGFEKWRSSGMYSGQREQYKQVFMVYSNDKCYSVSLTCRDNHKTTGKDGKVGFDQIREGLRDQIKLLLMTASKGDKNPIV